MSEFDTSDDHRPITSWGGYPIYASHLLVIVFVASMVVTAILMSVRAERVLDWLPFYRERVFKGEVWRYFTYGFLNGPSIDFAIRMVMFAWFGREVERSFGRRTFLRFYVSVYLMLPLLFTAIGFWFPMLLAGEPGAFAVFIAFATLFPNVAIFFGLLSKWIAAILIGIFALMALAGRNWSALISLFATSGFAFAFVRYEQGRLTLPKFRFSSGAKKTRARSDSASDKSAPAKTATDTTMAEVDALLDKIARSGFGSLTAKERAKLESARAELLKRDSRR